MSETAGSMDPLTVPLHGRHVVEASAGTGKTFTIATLHLRFVLEAGVPASKVLVATFTEAATAELKDRLRANLRGRSGSARTRPRRARADVEAADRVAIDVLAAFGVEPPTRPTGRGRRSLHAGWRRRISAFDAARCSRCTASASGCSPNSPSRAGPASRKR